MSVVYPPSCLVQESVIDMVELERTAYGLVREIIRRTRLTNVDCQIFRADMVQESLAAMYEFVAIEGYSWPYAYGAARHRLLKFVIEQIEWRQAGFAHAASRKYRVQDNFVESDGAEDEQEFRQGTRIPMWFYKWRPTEEAVIIREKGEEQAESWVMFEREIARILAGLCETRYPSSLQRAAAILCESAKGVSRAGIALKLKMDKEMVDAVLKHYRVQLYAFLAQSPVMQGLIRAKGQLCLLWWDEVTEEALNSGQKFIVIYPHGAFAVRFKKVGNQRYGKLMATKCLDGTLNRREVSLGRVGNITSDRLYDGTRRLQSKMSTLSA